MSERAIHTRCAHCHAPIEQAHTGRHRRYCSATCRKAASRERQSSWEWIEENDPQVATLEDVWVDEHGAPPSPEHSTIDDVTATIAAAVVVAGEFRRHGVAALPQFAARCAAVGAALDAALEAEFGDVL